MPGLIQIKIFSLKIVKKVILSLIIIFIFEFFLFPAPILASEISDNTNISEEILEESEDIVIINNLPENDIWETEKTGYYTITAYSSETSQCDSSPCITANGFNLCEHGIEDSVAANFLAFGTKIRIPDLFGEKVFIVRDRMNPRHQNRLDIWMQDKQKAKEFGVKIAKIEILE